MTAKTAGTATFTSTDITNGAMTANTSPATTINAGAFTKLQILLPGETAAPGTASGKTGAPTRSDRRAAFNVIVNAVDANWNVVSSTDTVGITSTDANATLPANTALVAGTKTLSVTAKTAGSKTFTATDISNGAMTANTSPATTINAGAFSQAPDPAPGRDRRARHRHRQDRRTQSLRPQAAASTSPSTPSTPTGTRSPPPTRSRSRHSDSNATLPANAALVAGTKTLSVTRRRQPPPRSPPPTSPTAR